MVERYGWLATACRQIMINNNIFKMLDSFPLVLPHSGLPFFAKLKTKSRHVFLKSQGFNATLGPKGFPAETGNEALGATIITRN